MIIFMGVSGAGKSIQGQLLADRLGIPWISTGELLRSQIDSAHDETMMAGKLFGDEQIIGLVSAALAEIPEGECILDGFPRTVSQAQWLIGEINAKRLRVQAVIHLHVSQAVMSSRLHSRGRVDDTDEAINQRFSIYQSQTLPLVDELRAAGVSILNIDGERSIETVSHNILRTLGINP